MIQFKYSAKGPGGQSVEGTISADSRAEAVAELRGKKLTVVRMDEASGSKKKKLSGEFRLTKLKPSAKKNEIVIFTRQLATMVGAGLALLESLEVLKDQAESPGMKLCCDILANEVRGGTDLSAAMEKCPKVFNHL